MKTCPKCGAEADGIFCLNCGAAVNSEPAAPAPTSKPVGNDFKEKPIGGAPYQPQQPAQPQQPYYPPQPPVQQPYYPPAPQPQQEKSGMATAAIVFAFLIPLVGFILGILGKKKYQSPALQKRCQTAIVISVIVFIINLIINFSSMM